MRLLLDTHTLMWADHDPVHLLPAARAAIADPRNEVWFSVINIWEMVIKVGVGKLTPPVPPAVIAAKQVNNGLRMLDVTLAHVVDVGTLPPIHRDPFDRLLVSQARAEGLTLVSTDPLVAQYPVPVLW